MFWQKNGITKKTSDGTMYEQKDIVLLPFPYTDLTNAKLRPALIISNNTINYTDDRICCLITSKQTTQGILLDDLDGSLPFRSWAKPQRIFTIHKKIIKKKLCSVTPQLHKKILEELNKHLK